MHLTRYLLSFACVVLMGHSEVWANSALRDEFKGLAKEFKGALDRQAANTVAVGTISPRSNLDASTGPGLERILAEELKKLNLTVTNKADYEITGHFQAFKDKKNDNFVVKIRAELRGPDGDIVVGFTRDLKGQESLPLIAGLTGKYSPNGDAEQRAKENERNLNTPSGWTSNATIRAAKDDPYGIEIYAKRANKLVPLNAQLDNGRPRVPIDRDDVFEIYLVNDSDQDAAVLLTLDGLSVFAFSQKNYTYLIVAKKTRAVVKGWHINDEISKEFVVRDYPETDDAKFKLRQRGNLGTITAIFSAAWAKGASPPSDESRSRGTTFIDTGSEVKQKYTPADRHIGNVRSSISVRYQKSNLP